MTLRTALTAAALSAFALAAAVGTPGSATAAPAPTAYHQHPLSVRGFARLDVQGPVPIPTQLLTLGVDAHTPGQPEAARGHATMQHVFYSPDGSWQGTIRVELAVDCLTEADGTTVLTGTAESVSVTGAGQTIPPARADWHPEIALSFHQDADGHPRVGYSGVPRYGDPTAPPVATRCGTPVGGPSDLFLVSGGFRG
ncbi:hypothetical protein ACFYNO_33285 [Kitasatospora sp. NPDC006697]|uniref:hypothetical protein n=1 Tax=Kitasatospora sp. NPDC006697 TaxID=3364020 RepID=UPI0036C3ABEB